jgi:predicted HTH transcriptional regulator
MERRGLPAPSKARQAGKGILRMINLMREYGLPPPRFELIGEELLVTFYSSA